MADLAVIREFVRSRNRSMASPVEVRMATTIYASCPVHGRQELTSDDVHLTIMSIGAGSYYEFRCKRCPAPVRKPADADVITALRSGNVTESVVRVPLEWAEHNDDAPVITWDDVLDLHLALDANPNLFDQLLQPTTA